MADRPSPAARRLIAALGLLLALITPPALAVEPQEVLSDPALEARAREIGRELRCLVCQNQSIDDSDADLARDLRRLVRERLSAGDDNQQVIDYVVSRYGDFVLLRPPLKPATYALWLGPPAILVIGAGALVLYYRRRRAAAAPTARAAAIDAPLDQADEGRLSRLMAAAGENPSSTISPPEDRHA
ncbi:MAG: cytochrome c-type biogenesis protein CcmH [Rhodospirillales bacterium]|nr:cytochrome c-type biogenesis protein CcmH [Rhodospirillales bacterium]